MFYWRIGAAGFFVTVAVLLVAYVAGWLDRPPAVVKGGNSPSNPTCPIPAYTQAALAGARPKIGADCSVSATEAVSLVFDAPYTGNRVRMTIKGRFDASKIIALVFASNANADDGWLVRHHHDFLGPGVLTLEVCKTAACPGDGPGYFPLTNYKGAFELGSLFTIVIDVDRASGKGDTIRTWMPGKPSDNPRGDMAYTAEGFSFAGSKLGIRVEGATIFAVAIETP